MAVPALPIILLRNPPSLATARVANASTTTPAQWQAFVAGETKSIALSICDGAGNLETLTGRTYRVTIGQINAPATIGSFPLADVGGATTGLLAYNVSAANVQIALNALNGGLGPSSTQVIVSGPDGGPFVVIGAVNGAIGLLTANVTDLTPTCTTVITEIQAGSGSLPEVQLIRIFQLPYAIQASWTISGTAATALLLVDSPGLYQWLAQNPSGPLYFEIEENDGTSVAKICQAPIFVYGDVAAVGVGTAPNLAQATKFTASISVDALTVAVTFSPAFASPPSVVIGQVAMPNNTGENIWATLIANSVTTTGATFSLSGGPTASGYTIQGIALS
jgi:hypothetical protein